MRFRLTLMLRMMEDEDVQPNYIPFLQAFTLSDDAFVAYFENQAALAAPPAVVRMIWKFANSERAKYRVLLNATKRADERLFKFILREEPDLKVSFSSSFSPSSSFLIPFIYFLLLD